MPRPDGSPTGQELAEARLRLATLLAAVRVSQDLGATTIQLRSPDGRDCGTFELQEFADDLGRVVHREADVGRHLAAFALAGTRGPCGIRGHAEDCDCGGAGGDR